MIKKIKTLLLSVNLSLLLAAPLAFSGVVMAQAPGSVQSGIESNICSGGEINVNGGVACTDQGGTDINNIIKAALNVISVIVGAIAVVMIIVGGFRYVVSGGKQESVASAKNIILYALIGLVIVAFAQVIVRFVLKETTDATT